MGVIYIPLEDMDMRYSNYLNILCRQRADKVLDVDCSKKEEPDSSQFLNPGFTMWYKSKQLEQISEMFRKGEVEEDDVFWFADIWFPGIEMIPYLSHFYKIHVKIRGIMHAGSFTDTDDVRGMERWAKNFEDVIADVADEIYFGSNFSLKSFQRSRIVEQDKCIKTGLIMDPILDLYKPKNDRDTVVFNGRLHPEKQPWLLDAMRKQLPEIDFISTHERRFEKAEYYDLLSHSKCVISFALQENFGYGIQEAALLGCWPVLPYRLCYKEQFSVKYLYTNLFQAVDMVKDAIKNNKPGESHNTINVKNYNTDILNFWFR